MLAIAIAGVCVLRTIDDCGCSASLSWCDRIHQRVVPCKGDADCSNAVNSISSQCNV
jgi:hypothetical protein